jgi:hypothetical protein
MKLVSEQFLFYPEWAILQLHHGKLFLDDDDVTIRPTLAFHTVR